VEGGKPSWGAKPFPKADRSGRFVALASGFAQDNDALPIRAQARVLGAHIKAGETVTLDLIKGGHSYLVPAKGAIDVNGTRVNARDGAAIRDIDTLTVTAIEDSEVVLVEAA
jgi:redox-sensitive bicupin YhaK (pirin superfamily)